MNFEQQIISTFIGALAGFVFSIFLFYLTEKWKNNKINKSLSSNLQKEFDYNINFLENYKENFETYVRQIAANNKQIYPIFRFSKLQRLFILETFSKGLLYKHLNSDEINNLDAMLSYFTGSMDQIHILYIEQYKIDKVSQQETLQRFEFSKGEIIKYLKLTKILKEKLK